jgi:predicted heme/steroid binding protein
MVKYFTQEELAVHNNPENCWVAIFDKVYDLSSLIMANRGPLSNPLVEAGGSSISHWFNEKSGDLKTYIDPVRNIEMFYTPCGRFIHVPPPDPLDRAEIVALPWWKDQKFIIGQVNEKAHRY